MSYIHRKASEMIMVVEASSPNWYNQTQSTVGNFFCCRMSAHRHGKKTARLGYNAFTNFAFFDGHVGLYPTINFQTDPLVALEQQPDLRPEPRAGNRLFVLSQQSQLNGVNCSWQPPKATAPIHLFPPSARAPARLRQSRARSFLGLTIATSGVHAYDDRMKSSVSRGKKRIGDLMAQYLIVFICSSRWTCPAGNHELDVEDGGIGTLSDKEARHQRHPFE